MRPLILKMSISIDGFVGTPDGGVVDLIDEIDAEAAAWMVETLANAGAHLMGRKTFEDMARFWPVSTEPFAEPMNRIDKIVFSRKGKIGSDGSGALPRVAEWREAKGVRTVAPDAATIESWRNPTLLRGDLREEVRRLKAQSGAFLLAHGGAGLARALIETGEIDEYRLLVHPVALGRGIGLFARAAETRRFDLVHHRVFPGGTMANVYRPRR